MIRALSKIWLNSSKFCNILFVCADGESLLLINNGELLMLLLFLWSWLVSAYEVRPNVNRKTQRNRSGSSIIVDIFIFLVSFLLIFFTIPLMSFLIVWLYSLSLLASFCYLSSLIVSLGWKKGNEKVIVAKSNSKWDHKLALAFDIVSGQKNQSCQCRWYLANCTVHTVTVIL